MKEKRFIELRNGLFDHLQHGIGLRQQRRRRLVLRHERFFLSCPAARAVAAIDAVGKVWEAVPRQRLVVQRPGGHRARAVVVGQRTHTRRDRVKVGLMVREEWPRGEGLVRKLRRQRGEGRVGAELLFGFVRVGVGFGQGRGLVEVWLWLWVWFLRRYLERTWGVEGPFEFVCF